MVSRPFSKELKKGSADLLILALVEDRPRHGYEIGRLIIQKSQGALSYHIASLYPTLYRLEDAGLVTRSRDAQRRPVHLEAEVFELMTKWIERYRRQAEERYQRLDAVLARMADQSPPTTDNGAAPA